MENILFLAAGVFAGTLGATLGLGGGIFLVPMMTLYLGMEMPVAIATSLLVIAANATAVCIDKVKDGLVSFPISAKIEFFSVVGAISGAALVSFSDPEALKSSFGGFTSLLALVMLVRLRASWVDQQHSDAHSSTSALGVHRFEQKGQSYVGLCLGSSGAGLLSGIFGIGGGALLVPLMRLFGGMPIKVAVATSAYVMGVTSAAAAVVLLPMADLIAAGWCVMGLRSGAWLSHRLTKNWSERTLQALFASMLLYIGLRMLL